MWWAAGAASSETPPNLPTPDHYTSLQNAVSIGTAGQGSGTLSGTPAGSHSDRISGTEHYLYFTANQLRRQAKYQRGQELRQQPYTLFQVKTGTQPVLPR